MLALMAVPAAGTPDAPLLRLTNQIMPIARMTTASNASTAMTSELRRTGRDLHCFRLTGRGSVQRSPACFEDRPGRQQRQALACAAALTQTQRITPVEARHAW